MPKIKVLVDYKTSKGSRENPFLRLSAFGGSRHPWASLASFCQSLPPLLHGLILFYVLLSSGFYKDNYQRIYDSLDNTG